MKSRQHWSRYTASSASTLSERHRRLQYMIHHTRPEIGENVRERYEESQQVFGSDNICTILVQQDEQASKRFLTSIMQDMDLVSMSPSTKKDHNRLAVSNFTQNTTSQEILHFQGLQRKKEGNPADKIQVILFRRITFYRPERQQPHLPPQ